MSKNEIYKNFRKDTKLRQVEHHNPIKYRDCDPMGVQCNTCWCGDFALWTIILCYNLYFLQALASSLQGQGEAPKPC